MARMIGGIASIAIIVAVVGTWILSFVAGQANYAGKCFKWHFQLSPATYGWEATQPAMNWLCDRHIPERR